MKRKRMRRPASSVKKARGSLFKDRWQKRELLQKKNKKEKVSKQPERVANDEDKSTLKSPKLKTLGRKRKEVKNEE